MPRYEAKVDFEHNTVPKLGILLLNLGTPDEPTPVALRRYLKEFLWDPRVVEMPRPVWWLILNLVILNIRPKRSAESYEKVWTDAGSPLLAHSEAQAAVLQKALEAQYPGLTEVALGMRYGNPSIQNALMHLRDAGVQNLLVLPLYPQYSGTTTGSAFDAVADVLRRWRWVPELRFITHYHDDMAYIRAMAAHIQRFWEVRGTPRYLLLSYHGIPKRYLLKGDPYHCQCLKTSRLLANELGLEDGQWRTTFQSRFGREEWLKPYTDKVLKDLPKEGEKSVDVFCPGFAADCLETLEEIAVENRQVFIDAGGVNFRYISAMNEEDEHINALFQLIEKHAQGWPMVERGYNREQAEYDAQQTQDRARETGAKA